jgi:DNA repair protein RecO (recombination protein O)
MPQVATEAVVLHAFDYSESSRIVRLATREAGVVSVLARGARRSRSRFGSALDLFAQGAAQLVLKEGRDLHTLASFDVQRARPSLGNDLGRFTGAATIAELAIRFGTDDPSLELYYAIRDALDELAAAEPDAARAVALAGAWRLIDALGFAPSLADCARCHSELSPDGEARFSCAAGGVLCEGCTARGEVVRRLPARALSTLFDWLQGGDAGELPVAESRAHQRLLREFVEHHLADGRPLRAFAAWEFGEWGSK